MAKFTLKTDSETLMSRLVVVLAVLLALLLAVGVFLVRDKLLLNANTMGVRLAQSYAEQEQVHFSNYNDIVRSCAISLNERIGEGASDEALSNDLLRFTDSINESVGATCFDLYAVVDGKILAGNAWEGDVDYNYRATDWYQNAVNTNDLSVTDVYVDAITGNNIITISMPLDGEGNVLAADVNLSALPLGISEGSLPDDTSYFLFDSNDRILVYEGSLDPYSARGEEYLSQLIENIRNGQYSSPSSSIVDVNGSTRGVYYFEMDNGWLAVITIPLSNILQDGWDVLFVAIGVVCIITVLFLFAAIVREHHQRKTREELRKTLRILGDRHYAIYRIDLTEESYRAIKRSPDLPKDFPNEGKYSEFLLMMKELVEESTYRDFCEAFSLDNIRDLIEEGVKDFGGDYQRKFGDTYRWVNVLCVYNKKLSENEALLCFREVSDEKKVDMKRREIVENAIINAERTEDKKNTLFSKASHDMRTPLNAIMGFSSLLEKNADDPEVVKDYAQKIERSGGQLLSLVNDLLDLSHVNTKEFYRADNEPLDLAQCLRECVESFQIKAEADGKKLTLHGADKPLCVVGSKRDLERVFNNLISNAVKYTNEGDSIDVTLRKFTDGKLATKYQIVVADTGAGMTKEFLDRIFEPFARETRFAAQKVDGTGLGMPIVKGLVQRMSGEITVTSKLGKGTIFMVTLPLPSAPSDVSADSKTEKKAKVDLDSALQGLKILVAEDNEINKEIIVELLHMMGAETIETANGKEAVEAFTESEPGDIDAILLDMFMPEMDGCTAARTIRRLKRKDAKTITILAVTANAFTEDIAQTTKAGMNGHLSKPINPEKLARLIVEGVKRQRER